MSFSFGCSWQETFGDLRNWAGAEARTGAGAGAGAGTRARAEPGTRVGTVDGPKNVSQAFGVGRPRRGLRLGPGPGPTKHFAGAQGLGCSRARGQRWGMDPGEGVSIQNQNYSHTYIHSHTYTHTCTWAHTSIHMFIHTRINTYT